MADSVTQRQSSQMRVASGRSSRKREGGFTLVEMLVVITIIVMIISLVGPRVLNYLSESKVKAAKIQIQSFTSALDLMYLDTGRYPTSAEGLDALVKPANGMTGWNGPYLRGGTVPSDPWGKPYIYRSPAERSVYQIVSYGSDSQEGGTGTAADISTANDE